jgi:hypothetical protein
MSVKSKLVEVSKDKVASLEKRLAGILKPVRPRGEFVRGLGQKFQAIRPSVVVNRFSRREFVFLVIGGLLSLSVLLALGVRAMISLLTALGLIQQVKSQKKVASRRA